MLSLSKQAIAAQISESGADYVLALKENHPTLYADTTLWMNTEFDAGRLEVLETLETCAEPAEAKTTVAWRHAVTPSVPAWACPEPAEGMAGGAGRLGGTEGAGNGRKPAGNKGQNQRGAALLPVFASESEHFAQHCRAHWSIENSQHWVLDVQFGEDDNRARTDHSAENLALLRRAALNFVRHNGKPRESLRTRRLRAGLNDEYRPALLTGAFAVAT